MEDLGKLLLRITISGLMLFHGFHKLFNGIQDIHQMLSYSIFPDLFAYGVFIGELLAPILIILGFYSRISALFVAFTMLVSITLITPDGIFNLNEYGAWIIELNILFLMGAISIFFIGPGKYRLGKQMNFFLR